MLDIQQTQEPFPPADGLAIVMECVVGTLRGLRRLCQQEPDRQPEFDAICEKVQPWLRASIDLLRFDKPS